MYTHNISRGKIVPYCRIINHVFVLQLTKESEEKVSKSRALIDDIVKESKTVYGITTGFGKFARTVIEKKKLE